MLRQLSDMHFPKSESIVLVQDNLNTHTAVSLCRAFPPVEARRIANRFVWHYTPKHGSRLNMANAELSVLARQCLAGRIPNIENLGVQVSAWQRQRNELHTKTDWRFANEDAHIKLKNLYPALQMNQTTRERWDIRRYYTHPFGRLANCQGALLWLLAVSGSQSGLTCRIQYFETQWT